MSKRPVLILSVALALGAASAAVGACSPTSPFASDGSGGGKSGGTTASGGGALSTSSITSTSADVLPTTSSGGACDQKSDAAGCMCSPQGSTRVCYPETAGNTRGVGACRDGMQTCAAKGEFSVYADCMGATVPVNEDCSNGVDDNCDGTTDCQDPTCATNAACSTGCQDGQTRACYDGPQGTQNVGTCRAGMQTCVGGSWPATCPGEVTPTAEVCNDALDHNCNLLPGCLDIFDCIASPLCQPTCHVDHPGCVCPVGSGDAATCPEGMLGISEGASASNPGTVECCPCTANDCGNAACCDESVCANDAQCNQYTCTTLPASCNGQVNFDCDDFPEDCDEPCCKCTQCAP